MAASVAVLAAGVQPENAEREDAVDGRGRLLGANANDGLRSCAAQQAPAHIGRAKAVFEIHGIAHALDSRFREVALENALQQAEIVAASAGDMWARYQPMRARRPVMCAVWWRECHA